MIDMWFDGSCGPMNPGGVAGIGVFIREDKKTIYEASKIVGQGPLMSCNVAEYEALIDGLRFLDQTDRKDENITVYGDSQLVIKQMDGENKIGKGLYVPSARFAKELVSGFSNIQFKWIPRERNERADELSKVNREENVA